MKIIITVIALTVLVVYAADTNSVPKASMATLVTKTITNVTTVKRSQILYGCLVGGCTADHSTTYWERTTIVRKVEVAEINGQQVELSRSDVSQNVTRFIPRVTPDGMTFEITTNGQWNLTEYGN